MFLILSPPKKLDSPARAARHSSLDPPCRAARAEVPPPARERGAEQKILPFLLEEFLSGRAKLKYKAKFPARQAAACGGWRRGGSVFPLKESSREVYNYSSTTNFVGNDCSARRPRGGQNQQKFLFLLMRGYKKFFLLRN